MTTSRDMYAWGIDEPPMFHIVQVESIYCIYFKSNAFCLV